MNIKVGMIIIFLISISYVQIADASSSGSHLTHTKSIIGPQIVCRDCHNARNVLLFKDNQPLATTTVCNICHSPGGIYDGVNDPVIGAKSNWIGKVYDENGNLKAGKEKWCVGCHDNSPATVKGEIAPNKTGDDSTYGYYITGHGRVATYDRMSWQSLQDTGNPGANKLCDACHNITSRHITVGEGGNDRLKPGYDNNQNNENCNNCHEGSGASPQFYTNSSNYEASAHGGKNCTECHDVHGLSTGKAMTKGNDEGLCIQCHGSHAGHAIDTQFGKDGKTYSLECTSCHNVHVITGMYTTNDPNKSPVSRFTNNLETWGDGVGEKMNDYVGGGTYRTPKNDTFSGSQLPDYVTFCLDCHATAISEFGSHGEISWGYGEPHGLNSANEPNGYGTCPNWFACGLAEGWDNDLCVGDESICWPAIPRGKGDQLFSRPVYNHIERIAGANFILSCTDCHVTHESGIGSKLRSEVNGAPGSTIWNTMCNACHYYYSDWHAGMSCGSASCHETNSIHRMKKNTGSGGIRTFNPDIVADIRFEDNLKDSGSFQMDGRWFDTAGSYVAGKSGSAVVLNGDQPIELGSENAYWSTDAGYHGTWVYSEMKKNMSLEVSVYPTGTQSSGDNIIFAKHTYTDGGYAILLKSIDGTLRAALQVNVNGGEVPWNSADCNGLRGAFSSIPIPLNQWTDILVIFDFALPDRDINNHSIGRIRIIVNGEDVTTSYPNINSCYAQPGAGENDIFPYSEMKIKNQSRCYLGSWCASALSIGGGMWGSGYRKGLIGRLDSAKVWNVVKDSTYIESIDQANPPKIIKVDGSVGRDWIIVTFSEGVYTNTGQSGALQASDFSLADIDDSRTILSADHNAGDSVATLTLSSPLDSSNDIDIDTIAANSNSIYDEYNNPADTVPTIITGQSCSSGPTIFQLNEGAGSLIITDGEGVIKGKVNDPSESLTGDGYFHGDGINNYIDFENNTQCMKSSTSMTIETRIKPSVVDSGGSSTIQRVLARDGGGNYQISVWRNTDPASFPNYKPPSGVASIAFWVNVVDSHGGDQWKPVLTNYTYYPIVANHYYTIKVVWNSGKTGGIPADIFVDDQGTDGNGLGENWVGFVNATDSGSQLTSNRLLYEGDQIKTADGQFVIGANLANHANNVFNGLIDYLKWKDSVDYTLE